MAALRDAILGRPWDATRPHPSLNLPADTAVHRNHAGGHCATPSHQTRTSKPGVNVYPAGSESHGMYGTSMRENREIPRSPVRLITGRDAQGTRGGTPEMHEGGKSDGPVVPANLPNKAVGAVAEAGEGRGVRRDKPAWRRRWKSSTPKV